MKNQLKQVSSLLNLIVYSFVIVVSLVACKKNEPAPDVKNISPKPVAVPVNQQVKPVQSVASSSKINLSTPKIDNNGNQFDFSNKKDPFKPGIVAKNSVTQASSDANRPTISVLPIHSFDVSQFRLIGIISGAKDSQAMVIDPNGKGYVVKQGMTIGKNEGRIVAITALGVDVLEQFKDDNGRIRKENIRITLPRKQ